MTNGVDMSTLHPSSWRRDFPDSNAVRALSEQEFRNRLDALCDIEDPEAIWRTPEEVEQLCRHHTHDGTGDRVTPSFLRADLRGRRVADLGSNIGYYSFLASIVMGAREVLAFDRSPRAIEVGSFFQARFGPENVSFHSANFLAPEFTQDFGRFDVAVLIDVMGDTCVREGRGPGLLAGVQQMVDEAILLVFRPVYKLKEHLKVSAEELQAVYPDGRIEDGRFHYLELLVRRGLLEGWSLDLLDPTFTDPLDTSTQKQLFRLRKV